MSSYDLPLPSLDSINYTIALLTLIGIGIAIWRSKSRRRMNAVADAILGQEEVTDSTGGIIRRGEPGLVHRVTQVEVAIVEFRHAIALFTEAQHRIDQLEQRVKTLEDDRVERIVTKAESAQMWRAVAEANVEPPLDEEG